MVKKVSVPDKDEVARELADWHYRVEPGITHIYRILGGSEVEQNLTEPIKLLEVNTKTVPAGVMPLYFGPAPSSGIHYPSVIVEVTPAEYEQIKAQQLKLPEGWAIGKELKKPERLKRRG